MGLVINQKVAGDPGVHALIAGISAYPHLNGGSGTLAIRHFSLPQLPSTASAAYSVYEWLTSPTTRLPLPLASCRMLLSPAPTEPQLVGKAANCDLANFLADLKSWQADAGNNADNITIFYFAGHGVQISGADRVILLEDFGDGFGGAFAKAVRFKEIYNGMNASQSHPYMATTQFYFVDTCASFPATLPGLQPMTTASVWDYEDGVEDRRVAPIFYAAAPGTTAWDLPAEPNTIFSKALLECLNGGAAERTQVNGRNEWNISTRSLAAALTTLLKEDPHDQRPVIEAQTDDALICRLDRPPRVEFIIEVAPSAAVVCTDITVLDDYRKPVWTLPPPLKPHPFSGPLPAGMYRITARITPATPPYTDYPEQSFPVMPPRPKLVLRVAA